MNVQPSRIFLSASFLISCYILACYLHIFIQPQDKKTKTVIEQKLENYNSVYFSEILPLSNANRVCVLPPYSTIKSIENEFSSIQKDYLNLRINKNIGSSERIWWIVLPSLNDKVNLYKISSITRPDFKHPKCISLNSNSRIFPTRRNGYIFFNIE